MPSSVRPTFNQNIFYLAFGMIYAIGFVMWMIIDIGSVDMLKIRQGFMVWRLLSFATLVAGFIAMVFGEERYANAGRTVIHIAGIVHILQQLSWCIFVKRFGSEMIAAMMMTCVAAGIITVPWQCLDTISTFISRQTQDDIVENTVAAVRAPQNPPPRLNYVSTSTRQRSQSINIPRNRPTARGESMVVERHAGQSNISDCVNIEPTYVQRQGPVDNPSSNQSTSSFDSNERDGNSGSTEGSQLQFHMSMTPEQQRPPQSQEQIEQGDRQNAEELPKIVYSSQQGN